MVYCGYYDYIFICFCSVFVLLACRCEKRLMIYFKPCNGNVDGNLRDIKEEEWHLLLEYAKCSILHSICNDNFDAYLLSESSLFVYKHKIVLKTCGRTSVLHILPHLLKICGNRLLLIPYFVLYSRSNLMFPNDQSGIYRNFNDEVGYLNNYFNGFSLVLGPLTSNKVNGRWNVYIAGSPQLTHFANDIGVLNEDKKSIEIIMFDVCPNAMKYYWKTYQKNSNVKTSDITSICGISNLLSKGAVIDSHMFDPCGYSVNGMIKDKYWSIHVTPEMQHSFVSFETNFNYIATYYPTINKIINLFKPTRFSFLITTINYKIINGSKHTGKAFNKKCTFESKIKSKNKRNSNSNGNRNRNRNTNTNRTMHRKMRINNSNKDKINDGNYASCGKRKNVIDWVFNGYQRNNHVKNHLSNHFSMCWANFEKNKKDKQENGCLKRDTM